MNKLLLFLLLIPTITLGQILPRSPRIAKYPSGMPIEAAFSVASPTQMYIKSPSGTTSFDPFAGKTNAYAESSIVGVICDKCDLHVRFGSSSIAAATNGDFYLATGVQYFFSVDANAPYMRIVTHSVGGAPKVYVSEIY